jgi:hypothetical protein
MTVQKTIGNTELCGLRLSHPPTVVLPVKVQSFGSGKKKIIQNSLVAIEIPFSTSRHCEERSNPGEMGASIRLSKKTRE